jgi:TonB family protein
MGPAIRSSRMSRAAADALVLAVTLLIADGAVGIAGESIWHPHPGPSHSRRDFDLPPKLLRTTTPEYPQAAYGTGREGTVVMELLIDAEGRLVDARVTKSIAEFDRAALACVSRWHFIPAQRRGRPVPAMATAMVTFKRPSKATPTSARGPAPSNRE